MPKGLLRDDELEKTAFFSKCDANAIFETKCSPKHLTLIKINDRSSSIAPLSKSKLHIQNQKKSQFQNLELAKRNQ